MARTKASVGAKVSSAKSSKARCSVAPPSKAAVSSGIGEKSKSYSGGNPVHPRETPQWQKPITNFFICKDLERECEDQDGDEGEAPSSSKSRKNVIESDDEVDIEETPKNQELDETIELEPLTGEGSHKIEEFYSKDSGKGKGVGKKTKGKENIHTNIERRNSGKRELESDGEIEPTNKKVKVK